MAKKPLKLTISFGKKYEDVFHYLVNKENTSKFICELVREEMKNGIIELSIEEKVHKIILGYLESEQLALNTDKPLSKRLPSDSKLMDEEIDLLYDLFG